MHVHEHTYSYDSISINQYIKKCEYEKNNRNYKTNSLYTVYRPLYTYILWPLSNAKTLRLRATVGAHATTPRFTRFALGAIRFFACQSLGFQAVRCRVVYPHGVKHSNAEHRQIERFCSKSTAHIVDFFGHLDVFLHGFDEDLVGYELSF